jgi:hypothetical protein
VPAVVEVAVRRCGVVCSLVVGAVLVASIDDGGAQTCERRDFEAVVDEAAKTLRTITHENTPLFQRKLRELKDKRGWSHDQFLKEGTPFVRDDKIVEFDTKSTQYLTRLNMDASTGAETAKPDCALLARLKESLAALVATQNEKWRYMIGKVDAALEANGQ